MKKFLKTTLAGAAILGCATGLVGCGGDKDTSITPDKAFSTVYDAMGSTLGKFAEVPDGTSLDTVKNMLTIDLDIAMSETYDGETESESIGIKTILQKCHGDTNQICAVLGLKSETELKQLISLYITDKDSNPEFVLIESEEAFNNATFVYKKVVDGTDERYVAVTEDDTWAANTYYQLTSNTIAAYLSTQFSELCSFTLMATEPDDWFDNPTFTEGRYYYLEDGNYKKLTFTDVYPEFDSFAANDKKIYSRDEEYNSNYTEVTTEPADWKTNWGYYFIDDENSGDESGKSPLFMMQGKGIYTTFKPNTYYEMTGVDIRYIGESIADTIGFEISEEVLNALYSSKMAIDCDYVALLDQLSGMLGGGDDSTGDDAGELPPTDDSATDDETGLASILGVLGSLDEMDFATFKALLTDEDGVCPFTFSGKYENGKTTFSMKYTETETEEGYTEYSTVIISFIADKNGSFEIALKYVMGETQDGELLGEMTVDVSLKVAYSNDFDNTLVPTDTELTEYGEHVDIMELLEGLFGGGDDDSAIDGPNEVIAE